MTTNLASHEPVLRRPAGDYVGRLVIEAVHETGSDGLYFSLTGPIMQQLMYGAKNTFKRRYDIWVADVLQRLQERVQAAQVALETAPAGELRTVHGGLDKSRPDYRGMVIVEIWRPAGDEPDLVVSLAGGTPGTERALFAEVVAASAKRTAGTAALNQ